MTQGPQIAVAVMVMLFSVSSAYAERSSREKDCPGPGCPSNSPPDASHGQGAPPPDFGEEKSKGSKSDQKADGKAKGRSKEKAKDKG